MPLDLLSLPDDVLLMIMSFGDNSSLCSIRATHRRFNDLLLTYPRQICDNIIETHFGDPYIPHYFQELTDKELWSTGIQSRFSEYPYHVRQLRRFGLILEYLEAVEDIMQFLVNKPKIRLEHFNIKGRRGPKIDTRRWVLIYFTILYHHNTLDLSFLQLPRHWPSNVPHISSSEWENAVTWVEMVLMAKIWQTVSADISVCPWNSPGEIFPLLRTFVRHTHPSELGEVVNSCNLEWSSSCISRQLLAGLRVRMSPAGDLCETWTRLYKGTVHDRSLV